MRRPALLVRVEEDANMQAIVWIATVLGIAGSVLNVKKHYSCFIVWEIANVLLIIYNLHITEYAQALLFAVYAVITGWGLISWIKDKK
jgi:nicotinamide riboside transporter PnuC